MKHKIQKVELFIGVIIFLSQFQVLCKPSLWCRIEIH